MKPAAIGAATGLVAGATVAVGSRGPTLVTWPVMVRRVFPLVAGTIAGISCGVPVGIGASVVRAAAGRGRLPIIPVALGVGALGAFVAAGMAARGPLMGRLTPAGRDLDPGYAEPPTNPQVSGGSESAVTMADLGREGARFVGSITGASDVRIVTGLEPVTSPVRVFIGVDAGDTVEQRVGLAMAELRRTGAFDRAHLLVQAPAGTGFANATPVDILEILTLGDCASVVIGYGLLPSFLSLGKVAMAAQTQGLLLEEITLELSARAHRPRLLLYGESLGAKVQQAALPRGPADLDRFEVAAALWVGTPGGRVADTFHLLCAAESITVDRPEQVPALMPVHRPRVWFLEHDGDPVVRSRPALLVSRPAWLPIQGSRGRNIPSTQRWRPAITYLSSLVDTVFATNVKPGDFCSVGHDYRADLGALTSAAFELPCDAATATRLESHLRLMEVRKAELIEGTGDRLVK